MAKGNGRNGSGGERTTAEAFELKIGLAEMLKGGVIMDVTDAAQAKIAEEAGACAVMALERVPADIRRDGGVARMSAVEMIEEIQRSVSIPVMAKVRIGHVAEADAEAFGLPHLQIDFFFLSSTTSEEKARPRRWLPVGSTLSRPAYASCAAALTSAAISSTATRGTFSAHAYRRWARVASGSSSDAASR